MKRTASVLLFVLLGCGPSYTSGKTQCSDDLECPGGFVCGRAQTGGTPVCYDQKASGCDRGEFYCAWLDQCVSSMSKCSGGGTTTTLTIGDFCEDTGDLACSSLLECYPDAMTQSECIQTYVDGCCADDGICQQTVSISQSVYEQCKSDLSDMSCTDWVDQSIPDSCLSV